MTCITWYNFAVQLSVSVRVNQGQTGSSNRL